MDSILYFNPRTHVGCDNLSRLLLSCIPYFNPRTHVGCDPRRGWRPAPPSNFNPRTHVGCDIAPLRTLDNARKISIHAPTWGATGFPRLDTNPMTDFNPRTHVGCDASASGGSSSSRDFNPRTHVGCDYKLILNGTPLSKFQSTHPRGVRLTHGAK